MNHPELEEFDGIYLPRLRLLTRLEAMKEVGCRFQMGDLAMDVWRDLIMLAEERGLSDQEVREKSQEVQKEKAQHERDAAKARKAAGIPESKFGRP